MGIFSSIVSGVKGAYNTVKSVVSDAASKVSNQVASVGTALGLNKPKTQTVSDPNVFGSTAYLQQNVQKGLQPAYGLGGAYGQSIPSFATPTSGQSSTPYGPQLPVSISAGTQKVGGGGGGSSIPSYATATSGLSSAPYGPTAPVSMTRSSLTNLGGGTSASGSNVSTTGSSMGSNPSLGLNLPSQFSSTNPQIDQTKLVAGGNYKYDPKTGLTLNEEENDGGQSELEKLMEKYGQKGLAENDPAVVAQTAERNRIREALRAPTDELNAVVTKQNMDLMAHRKMISDNGGTTTGFGGVEAAINYNAAMRALPLQASIASLQGDLELAQDYLTELTDTKQKQIDNQYDYNMKLFGALAPMITEKNRRKYEEKIKANDDAAKQATDLNKYQAQIMAEVSKNNPNIPNLGSVLARINNSTDMEGAVQAAGKYLGDTLGRQIEQQQYNNSVLQGQKLQKEINTVTGTGGGQRILDTLPTSIQGKVISMANDFGSKDIVKKYNSTVDSINVVNGIDAKSKNPADHQQIVYAFAKSLDPDSAVREGEYATIKKYAQSAVSKYGKEITNAINGTGFLSEAAIKNIQSTMNQTLNSRKPLYDNAAKETARVINNIAGTDVAKDLLIDYSGGASSSSSGNIDYTATLDSIFK